MALLRVVNRLVVQREVVAFDGTAETALDVELSGVRDIHRVGIELVQVAALLAGLVRRGARIAHEMRVRMSLTGYMSGTSRA